MSVLLLPKIESFCYYFQMSYMTVKENVLLMSQNFASNEISVYAVRLVLKTMHLRDTRLLLYIPKSISLYVISRNMEKSQDSWLTRAFL